MSEGASAQAASYIECAIDDKVLWGIGIDANTTRASLKAVVSAVNRAAPLTTLTGGFEAPLVDPTGGAPSLSATVPWRSRKGLVQGADYTSPMWLTSRQRGDVAAALRRCDVLPERGRRRPWSPELCRASWGTRTAWTHRRRRRVLLPGLRRRPQLPAADRAAAASPCSACPLLPRGEAGPVVECAACRRHFGTDVLDHPTTTRFSAMLRDAVHTVALAVLAAGGTCSRHGPGGRGRRGARGRLRRLHRGPAARASSTRSPPTPAAATASPAAPGSP